MDVLVNVLQIGAIVIAVFLLMFFAFGLLVIDELYKYCKNEVDKDAYEARKRKKNE